MESSEESANTEKSGGGSFWHGKKKLLLLVGIPLVIGLAAVTTTFVTSYSKDRPVALSADIAAVDIGAGGYSPQTIKIKKGQTINWTNADTVSHQLMADPEKLPDFETPEFLDQGDTYAYIFDQSGTFNYYDPADPKKFVGSIIVE